MRAATLALLLIACGDDDSGGGPRDARPIDAPGDAPGDVRRDAAGDAAVPIDAAGGNGGFTKPTAVLAAWSEPTPGTFTPETLDLGCLGAARNDPPTTVAVSLTVTVRDFQSNNVVPSAQVAAFAGTNPATPLSSGTTNGSGNVTLGIPTNQQRIGFLLTSASSRPTYLFDHLLAPSTMSQARTLRSLSNATAATLPALIGQTAMPNTAIVIATMRDCQGHTVSNFIATMSTTPSTTTHAMPASTFYFDESVGLPVRHSQAPHAKRNGIYMVIDVPPLATGYLQVWGFVTTSELNANLMTRIAEIALPVTLNAAILVEQEPRATN
ncbi:MAG TPA: hypothetical protein VIV11_05255 [Kofleriaceae bacterium]